METSSPPDTRRHIRGLDRIRFVLAFWVAFGHFGLVGLPENALRQGKQIYLRLLIGNVVSAPAAVIAFFVLSGLCIHYPQPAIHLDPAAALLCPPGSAHRDPPRRSPSRCRRWSASRFTA
jgi:hypothetical protein